jgi:ornithine cyclodeaminase/alanine dehydrogenase-like protein (mu-crystallin family)
VADDRTQSVRFGEGQALGEAAEPPTLGEVLAGTAPGRTRPDELTVFDSTGLGLHDIATADAAVRRAREVGAGTSITL